MNEPIVKINQGVLKGVTLKTEFGDFLSFNGIPYAEPPIGELRFKVNIFFQSQIILFFYYYFIEI